MEHQLLGRGAVTYYLRTKQLKSIHHISSHCKYTLPLAQFPISNSGLNPGQCLPLSYTLAAHVVL